MDAAIRAAGADLDQGDSLALAARLWREPVWDLRIVAGRILARKAVAPDADVWAFVVRRMGDLDGWAVADNLAVVGGRCLLADPARLEIVADGRSVAVRDQKLDTQDLYFIAQTPLKFLLKDHVDLAKDTTVKRVTIDENAATIEIEDKATFGGSANIVLVFDPDSFALKQWTVIDAQGFQTVVSLFNVDLTSKPDPDLFHIDQAGPTGQNPHH